MAQFKKTLDSSQIDLSGWHHKTVMNGIYAINGIDNNLSVMEERCNDTSGTVDLTTQHISE